MRTLILAMGTSGDVELLLRLAQELTAVGHRVSFAASPFFQQTIESAGCEAIPVGTGTREDLVAVMSQLRFMPDRMQRVEAFYKQWIQPQISVFWTSLSQGALGIDCFINHLKLPLRDVPTINITYEPPNRVSDLLQYSTRRAQGTGHVLEIVALDRDFADPQAAWPPEFRFTGFWKAQSSVQVSSVPSRMTEDSLPVVLTMGSMTCFDRSRLVATFSAAMELLQRSGIIFNGWAELSDFRCGSPSIRHITEEPYDSVFGQAGCVIHHGGYGAVTSVLRTGVPSVVLPLTPTQEAFANLLRQHGVAGTSLDIDTMTPAQLAASVQTITLSAHGTRAAAAWKSRTQCDDGVKRTVTLIDEHLSNRAAR